MELNLNRVGEYTYRVYKNRHQKQKNLVFWALLIVISSIIIMAIFLPNNKEVKPYSKVGLVVNGFIVNTKTPPIISGTVPLVSYNDIKEYIDKNIFYDSKNSKVIITADNRVIRIKADKNTGLINNKTLALNTSMKIIDGIAYIPIGEFKDVYNISVAYFKENNVVVIDSKIIQARSGVVKDDNKKIWKAPSTKDDVLKKVREGESIRILEEKGEWFKVRTSDGAEGFIQKKYVSEDALQIKDAKVKNNSEAIRSMPSIKHPIFKKANKGDPIIIFGEVEDWYKVRTNDGILGFVQKKSVTNEVLRPQTVNTGQQNIRWKPTVGKINLVWEQIERSTPPMDNVDKVSGLDVVSPTWFEIVDGNGKIKNKADSAYVRWAKANGYKVWGLVSNGLTPDKTSMTSKFLNNSDTRESIINELIYLAQLYEIDGINVDFEYVDKKDKDLLTQFMRELAPLCKDKGFTLSIDVTVKVDSENSVFFDRRSLSETVDYVIVMTYDQYWSTSPVSGSVAQYSWVENSIKAILEDVPKEKLIMGIPFYTRQWKEVPGLKPVSSSITMANTQNIIRQNNAKVVWDEASGQYYAEFSKNNAKYRIWVEDVKSVNLKSSLVLKYDLAGAASWRRGYETPDIWGVLKRNLKDIKTYDEWKKN